MLTGQELLETICAELQEIGMKQMAGKLKVMYRSDDFLTMDHLTLLADLIEPEYNEKITKRVKTRLKNANLLGCPYELGDCANSNEREYFPAGITESLSSLNFVEEGLNVCILGPSDSGKTYLAKALGVKACQDYRVAYCHCESLIEDTEGEIKLVENELADLPDKSKLAELINKYDVLKEKLSKLMEDWEKLHN